MVGLIHYFHTIWNQNKCVVCACVWLGGGGGGGRTPKRSILSTYIQSLLCVLGGKGGRGERGGGGGGGGGGEAVNRH